VQTTEARPQTDPQPVAGLQPETKPVTNLTKPAMTADSGKRVPTEQPIAARPEVDSQPDAGLLEEAKPEPGKTAPVAAKTAAGEIRRENWLLSQDAESYTIQIVGVSKEASMLDFIKKHQFLQQTEFAYYESTFRGKPWYQLLYGLYPTYQDARLAANQLPENIRRAEPWIRKISAVQNTIGGIAGQ
jgi:DamX protein